MSLAEEPIRLVIWDLDETFWRGTLTEGGVKEFIKEHHDIIITLAKRGILSSICSKNDYDKVRDILIDQGLWEYFVFPSIDWTAKGHRVAHIVDVVGLRAPTIMFIDDNPSNLAEVKAFVPEIQVADETYIPKILDSPLFKGKDDSGLSRLNQYKLLEQRKADELAAGGDNADFLRSSNIRVVIEHDVETHLDRAIELVNRTNQLNFTKRRVSEDKDAARASLLKDLRGYNVQAGLVKVIDNYGDYGYVGFFLKRGGWSNYELSHFCFSCRTLGMKVERWVYDWLGRPDIKVSGEVLTDLSEPLTVDWVTLVDSAVASTQAPAKSIPSIRLRGGCDLEALAHYLRANTTDLISEFNFVRDGTTVRVDHSLMLIDCVDPPNEAALAAVKQLGFRDEDFRSAFFDPAPKGSIWIYSAWADAKWFVYRHRETDFRVVPYGAADIGSKDVTKLSEEEIEKVASDNRLSDDRRQKLMRDITLLKREFICDGFLSAADIKANYQRICSKLPQDQHIFVILGNEIGTADGEPVLRRTMDRMNKAILEVVERFPNVSALQLRDFTVNETEIQGADHFNRMVYFRLYKHLLDTHFANEPSQSEAERVAAETV